MQDLTFLRVQTLVIHQLPSKTNAGVLSDAESPLKEHSRNFFEERIRVALTTEGAPIEFVEEHESPVPEQIAACLSGPVSGRIEATRAIASRLFEVQNKVHSEGLLCVAFCKLKKNNALAIIKLEKEEGVRAELVGPVGNQHFEIVIVDDLMLTKKTRVFKVALFELVGAEIDGHLCDNQSNGSKSVASYFLDAFLGCKLRAEPDIATQVFMSASERFINREITDGPTRSQYQIALMAELLSNKKTIKPREFAAQTMKPAEAKTYLALLKDAEVPLPSFRKDRSLVEAKLSKVRYAFKSGAFVVTPSDEVGESVFVEEGEEGRTVVQIEGELDKVNSHR